MNPLADRAPVIVGVGEFTQRTKMAHQALEPLRLMESALCAADEDGGGNLLKHLDSLDVVCELSWPYVDAPGQLSERLALSPKRLNYGEVGGETPVRFIHEAALRIARGESQVAAVVGAEAAYAAAAAEKQGLELPWSPRDPNASLLRGAKYQHAIAERLGVASPATAYPFYENATQTAWGQTPRQALAESGRLWAKFSAVAALNPHAWKHEQWTAEQITAASPENRLVAWPYTKRMVANPLVNQGAAVIVTSRGMAKSLGISDHRMVYVCYGASAHEANNYLQRDQFHCSHAQEAVLQSIVEQTGSASRFDFMELYSCFPVIPKMARRTLALAADAGMTVTGGLSFFGAPLNNYMSHATAALVRALRQGNDNLALLYGQGGYVTKHHGIVLSSRPPERHMLTEDYSVQSRADAQRGLVPELKLDYSGPGLVETFTVLYQRDGTVKHGVVIARTPEGQRLMAAVSSRDVSTLTRLTDLDQTPVGQKGVVTRDPDGLQRWQFPA